MKSYADKEPKRVPKITEEQQNTAAVQQKTAGGRPAEGSIAQLQAMVRSSRQAMQLKEMKALMQAGKRQAQSKDTAQLAGPLDEEELQFKSKEAVQKKGPLDEEELQFKSKEAVQKKGPLDEDELQFKKDKAVQCKGPEDEDDLQFKAKDIAQLAGPLDEEELQFKAEEPVQKQENKTGLPDDLKAGVENMSGMAMDDVRVHYNSGKPAQLNAYAYTQGTEIHVAPGQEKHLPHEAWHVVQQKQGRVQPTMQMAGGVAVNDDKGLEREAEMMIGEKLMQKKSRKGNQKLIESGIGERARGQNQAGKPGTMPIQRMMNTGKYVPPNKRPGYQSVSPQGLWQSWVKPSPKMPLTGEFLKQVDFSSDGTAYELPDGTKGVQKQVIFSDNTSNWSICVNAHAHPGGRGGGLWATGWDDKNGGYAATAEQRKQIDLRTDCKKLQAQPRGIAPQAL